MSLAAGATGIAETARKLEEAGRANDRESIQKTLAGFLAEYRSLLPLLVKVLQ